MHALLNEINDIHVGRSLGETSDAAKGKDGYQILIRYLRPSIFTEYELIEYFINTYIKIFGRNDFPAFRDKDKIRYTIDFINNKYFIRTPGVGNLTDLLEERFNNILFKNDNTNNNANHGWFGIWTTVSPTQTRQQSIDAFKNRMNNFMPLTPITLNEYLQIFNIFDFGFFDPSVSNRDPYDVIRTKYVEAVSVSNDVSWDRNKMNTLFRMNMREYLKEIYGSDSTEALTEDGFLGRIFYVSLFDNQCYFINLLPHVMKLGLPSNLKGIGLKFYLGNSEIQRVLKDHPNLAPNSRFPQQGPPPISALGFYNEILHYLIHHDVQPRYVYTITHTHENGVETTVDYRDNGFLLFICTVVNHILKGFQLFNLIVQKLKPQIETLNDPNISLLCLFKYFRIFMRNHQILNGLLGREYKNYIRYEQKPIVINRPVFERFGAFNDKDLLRNAYIRNEENRLLIYSLLVGGSNSGLYLIDTMQLHKHDETAYPLPPGGIMKSINDYMCYLTTFYFQSFKDPTPFLTNTYNTRPSNTDIHTFWDTVFGKVNYDGKHLFRYLTTIMQRNGTNAVSKNITDSIHEGYPQLFKRKLKIDVKFNTEYTYLFDNENLHRVGIDWYGFNDKINDTFSEVLLI